jgi:voltage-gated potassium channel
MSLETGSKGLTAAHHRQLIVRGVLRSIGSTVVLVALYYLLPLDHINDVPVTLVAGLLVLVAMTVLQVRWVAKATHPAVRAIEALSISLPLFLLLFASSYFIMANANSTNFSAHPLTRTDTLYFTVTVFSTVGFGDITATSQGARLVVTVQMLLDLLAVGLVVRVFFGAMRAARHQTDTTSAPDVR